jgi:hypothetical protein
MFMEEPDFIPASGFSAEPRWAAGVPASGPLPEGPFVAGWAKAVPTKAALMKRAATMDLRIIISDGVSFSTERIVQLFRNAFVQLYRTLLVAEH